jgi:hypothetical protein
MQGMMRLMRIVANSEAVNIVKGFYGIKGSRVKTGKCII